MNTSFIFTLLAIVAILAIVIVAMGHQEKKAEAERLAAEAKKSRRLKLQLLQSLEESLSLKRLSLSLTRKLLTVTRMELSRKVLSLKGR